METLKDIKRLYIDSKNHYDYSLDDEGISLIELRQVAKKWIEHMKKDIGNLPDISKPAEIKELLIGMNAVINWITKFFNLEEK